MRSPPACLYGVVGACEARSPQTLAEGLGQAAQAQSAPHVQDGPQEQPPSHAVQPTCMAQTAQPSARHGTAGA